MKELHSPCRIACFCQGVIFKAAPVGFLDVHATKVYATGTAATNLVAMW